MSTRTAVRACRPAAPVALVSGAARGLGLAIAQQLVADGCTVWLTDVDAAVVAAAQGLAAGGGQAHALVGDVSDSHWVATSVRRIVQAQGRLDILVNNAGISPKHGGRKALVQDMTLTEWRQVLDVNLTAAFLLCRDVLPGMQQLGWGRIINISSQAGRTRSLIAGAHYAASKAGLIGFSRTLAAEVAAQGITVNCIAPGRIDTPMADTVDAATNAGFLAGIPMGRAASPAEVASAVAYLAGDGAAYITGATLDINGGSFMS